MAKLDCNALFTRKIPSLAPAQGGIIAPQLPSSLSQTAQLAQACQIAWHAKSKVRRSGGRTRLITLADGVFASGGRGRSVLPLSLGAEPHASRGKAEGSKMAYWWVFQGDSFGRS